MSARGALWLGLLASACASALPPPDATHVARARQRYPDASLSELERGRELYTSRCAGCHALHAPGDVAAGAWPSVVEEMRTKHGVKLRDDDARAIVRYLVGVSP